MITSKQRAYLRGLANKMEPIFQIGKGGINENLIKQLDDALEARELIKLHILETAFMDSRETLSELAEVLGAEPVQAIGSKIVLYRASENKKKIEL
ncbi:MAG: ribosome assembly RNA-binding protein YhbY [Clostridia bacterium]|nr:ribosome assembly RNA-binding protein YhbY [Clostridia bacterium]